MIISIRTLPELSNLPGLGYVTTKTSSGLVWKFVIKSQSDWASGAKWAGIFKPKTSINFWDIHWPSAIWKTGKLVMIYRKHSRKLNARWEQDTPIRVTLWVVSKTRTRGRNLDRDRDLFFIFFFFRSFFNFLFYAFFSFSFPSPFPNPNSRYLHQQCIIAIFLQVTKMKCIGAPFFR